LQTIQKQLFVLGAVVAKAKVELTSDFLKKIETESSKLQNIMADDWHSRFVLPGGHEVAAHLDITRVVCRRLERVLVSFTRENETTNNQLLLQIINRLSDYLYVLRCFVNEEFGVSEYYV
jgi:cob(I)alamin adenosyltransferase